MKTSYRPSPSLFHALAIVLVLIGFLPPAPAQAAPAGAGLFQLDEPWWDVQTCLQAPCPADDTPTIRYTGSKSNYLPQSYITYLKAIPTGVNKYANVYVMANISVTWVGSPPLYSGNSNDLYLEIRILRGAAPIVTKTIPCGHPKVTSTDTCSVGILEAIPYADIPSGNNLSFEVKLVGILSVQTCTGCSTTYDICIGFVPCGEETCMDDYMIQQTLVNDETIIPTLETPSIYGTDDQYIAEVTEGGTYALTVVGGPWNDGSADSYETAFSFDQGTTWVPVADFVVQDYILCYEASATNPFLFVIIFEGPPDALGFMIRVNDTAGNFGDNGGSGAMKYSLWEVTPAPLTECGQQFTYDVGSPFAHFTVQANDADGKNLSEVFGTYEVLTAGEWYVIETQDGPWSNGGYPEFGMEMDWAFGNEPADAWFPIGQAGESLVYCTEAVGDNQRIYVQAGLDTTSAWFRMLDAGSNFADNSGYMTVSIYEAEFSRFPAACEGLYVAGSEISIKSGNIPATAENGIYLGTVVATPSDTNYFGTTELAAGYNFKLEISGGPWWYKGIGHENTDRDNYDAAISYNGGETWEALTVSTQWESADCVTPVDALGHTIIYFTVPAEHLGQTYRIRVNDVAGGFGGNGGSLDYSLEMIQMAAVDPGSCQNAAYTETETWLTGGTINANSATGRPLTTLESVNFPYGGTFVVHVVGGPWHETNVLGVGTGADYYGVQITRDGGTTWTELFDADFVICKEVENTNDYVFFFTYQQGETWQIRVDSSSFDDNAGTRGFIVYATAENALCEFDGTTFRLFQQDVNEKSELGEYIGNPDTSPGIAPGIKYILETVDGPWYDNGNVENLFEFSSDNGTSWYPITSHPSVDCARQYLNQYKVSFWVDAGEVWKIRVAETEEPANFNNNTGSKGYILYEFDDANDPITGTPGAFPGAGIPPADPCATAVMRPTDPLDVGGWLEYVRGSTLQYFAWCQRHTDRMLGLKTVFASTEPYGTINDLLSVSQETRQAVDGYSWGGTDGENDYVPSSVLLPSGGTSRPPEFLPSLRTDSPYYTGRITIRDTSSKLYASECRKALGNSIGPFLLQGICFATDMQVSTGMAFWAQFILEMSAVGGFLIYMWMQWIRPLFGNGSK